VALEEEKRWLDAELAGCGNAEVLLWMSPTTKKTMASNVNAVSPTTPS
jgi:hypothetical protein